VCSGEAQAAGEVVMQRAAARRASPAAAVTAKSLSSAPSLLSLLCVLSASAAAGHLADITIDTGSFVFGRPALLWNAGGAASDETAAARVGQSCTPDRGAAAPAPAGRAARTASAAAIVPGTPLSLALFATRPLSDSSAAGPGRDITKRELPTATTRWRSGHYRAKKLCETRPNCQLPQ